MNSLRRIAASLAFAGFAACVTASTTFADQAPLKVGVVFSFTGNGGNATTLLNGGMDAYIKEHGDSVAGRKIVLIKRDDTGMAPEVARRVAQDAILNDHVDLLAGLLFTPNAIAVGDGANDLAMLSEAGIGVALHAKPHVQESSLVRINHADLTALLYLQGYKRSQFVHSS